MSSKARSIDVVLIGRESRGDENLAIRYLAAHLASQGHRAHMLAHNSPGTLMSVTQAVMDLDPRLVGLSIPDGDAAIDGFALVRALRNAGFDGHLTCGGALATLTRLDLLERHPGIDSVVRLEGEVPLARIADVIARGGDPRDIPGVTTRSGDGPPAPVTHPAPLTTRPIRHAPPRILGVSLARMIASRGCPGRCPYCGPAALQEQAVSEGLADGASLAHLARQGVGGTRRRDIDDVADEMADLHHDRDVRFFHFIDDNLLPPGEQDALAWIGTLKAALMKRGLGKIALGLQMPASTATPAVVSDLVDLGLVRAQLGVESLDAEGLRALGRGSRTRVSEDAIRNLARYGVATFFNCLLVHPDSTPGTLVSEIEALEPIEGVLWNAYAVTVHNGSALWRRMLHDGRLEGNMLSWRFGVPSPVVERMRAALVRIQLQGFGRYDASMYGYDLAVSLAIDRRLDLRSVSPSLQRRLERICSVCNGFKLHILRRTLSLCFERISVSERSEAMEAIIHAASSGTRMLMRRLAGIERDIEEGAGRRGQGDSLVLRSCLAAGFAFCMGAALPGCWQEHGRSAVDDATTEAQPDVVDIAGETIADATLDSTVDPAEDAIWDPPMDPAFDLPAGCDDPHADFPPEGADLYLDVDCEIETWRERSHLGSMLRALWECEQCLPGPFHDPYCYYVVIDETGHVVDVRHTTPDGDSAIDPAVVNCYLEALGEYTFPCLDGEEIDFYCYVTLI